MQGVIGKVQLIKELKGGGSLLNRKAFGWWRLERCAGRFCDFAANLHLYPFDRLRTRGGASALVISRTPPITNRTGGDFHEPGTLLRHEDFTQVFKPIGYVLQT